MANKYQSKRTAAQRKSDNARVAHGTVRQGAGGRTMRRYNATTGRWNAIAVTGKSKKAMSPTRKQTMTPRAAGAEGPKRHMYKLAGSGKDGVNAASSVGSAHSSGSPVTETKGVKVDVGRMQRAQTRQSAVKKVGIYGAGLAVPATRIPTFLTGAAQLGSAFGRSSAGRSFGKNIKKQAQRPGRWLSGY
jgi:hypothetical protein